MTKFVLVNLWGNTPYPLLGLGYITSYLKKYGGYNTVKIIESDEKHAVKEIKAAKPDLLAFTASTPNYYSVENTAGKIKQELDIPILIGGPHITPIPNTLSKNFDIAVLGEGEKTFLELVDLFEHKGGFDKKDLKKIDGIAYHGNKRVKITNPRKLITPLDKIPFPERDLYDMDYYLTPKDILCNKELTRGTSLLTSRGCPYKCIYCQASTHWGNIRLNSSDYVAEEIKMLYEKYKVESIAIVDDLFIVNHKRVEEIISKLKEHGILGEIKFLVDGRANLINNKILSLLKKMNAVQISIGFETGSDRMLRYLKKNSVTLKQNLAAIEKISKFGFGIYGQFMIGSPTETKKEMYETLKLIKNDKITTAHISITTPLPGTEIWDYCVKQKMIDPNSIDWSKFALEPPKGKVKNNTYINEVVPPEEFEEIYYKFREESLMKEMAKLELIINFDTLKKAIRKPGMAMRLLPRLLKSKFLGFSKD